MAWYCVPCLQQLRRIVEIPARVDLPGCPPRCGLCDRYASSISTPLSMEWLRRVVPETTTTAGPEGT
jgi:hypothetical protein